jgi:DNA-binding response OmpR family regulator
MQKILVIDNDAATRRLLRQTLASAGFELAMVSEGNTAISMIEAEMPSAVIMEPLVPGVAGQDLCREIRSRCMRVPILVLSSAKAEIDKVVLLELGADDYVTKPFSPRELLARVRAAVRRLNQAPSNGSDYFTFGDIQVHFGSMEVLRDGMPVQLTPQEFKMLRFFINNAGRVICEQELLQQVWGTRANPRSRTIATHILRLRQKLERSPAEPVHFRTVHGAGYKFTK